ncbi:MAG: hypothetical protein R2836_04600 [Chitinophagales bacterium]|nr:hypothetical protein [Chitinophagales bacterium]
MKKNLLSIVFICFALVFTNSCDNDGNDDDNTPQNDGILTAVVNEANPINFEADFAEAVFTKGVGGSSNLYALYVTGNEGSIDRNINFTVYTNGITTTGSYPLKFNLNHNAYYYENYGSDEPFAWLSPDYSNTDTAIIHGTITFTEITETRTTGTFEYTAKENLGTSIRTVTNGTFNVPLKRQGF